MAQCCRTSLVAWIVLRYYRESHIQNSHFEEYYRRSYYDNEPRKHISIHPDIILFPFGSSKFIIIKTTDALLVSTTSQSSLQSLQALLLAHAPTRTLGPQCFPTIAIGSDAVSVLAAERIASLSLAARGVV